MRTTLVGRVMKQTTPEQCVISNVYTNYPLAPGDYVEILQDDLPLLGIVEGMYGDSVTTQNRLSQYEYECRFFNKGPSRNFLGDVVSTADENTSLPQFFNPKPSDPTKPPYPLNIGELTRVTNHVPVVLNGRKLLGTHSCVFGSSGSGKTTLLGLLLEEILLRIPNSQIVVLDPNSDFAQSDLPSLVEKVNFNENPCEVIDPTVLVKDQVELGRLIKLNKSPRVRMDRFSYDELMQIENVPYHFSTQECYDRTRQRLSSIGVLTPGQIEKQLRNEIQQERTSGLSATGAHPLQEEDSKGRAILADFFTRIKNAPIWSDQQKDSLDDLENNQLVKRLHEFNLGGLRFAHRAIIAEAVLRTLWTRNEKRNEETQIKTFIVIDEAHNVAPAIAEEPWQKRTTEWVNRISGEGRKYGLYLILVSQRPAKIHANTLDNCKNFFILRLENQDDLDSLSRRTAEVTESLLSRAAIFRSYEALLFGDLCPPAIIHPGRRRMK